MNLAAWVDALAFALVHSVWLITAIALAAAGSLRLLRGSDARLRYLVATGFLALMPLSFGLSVWLRSSGNGEALLALGQAGVEAFRGGLPPVATALAVAWAVGVSTLSLRLTASLLLLEWRVRRQSQPLADDWQDRVDRLASRLGLGSSVAVRSAAWCDSPVVLGILRPTLLLPLSVLSGLSPSQVEAVLVHELAHIRRHDFLVNLLQSAVEATLFHHPAMWWLSAQVRREREFCCDDVVAGLHDRKDYAVALVLLERGRRNLLAPAANGHPLRERVERLVNLRSAAHRRGRWAALIAGVGLLAGVVTLQWTLVQREARAHEAGDLATGGVNIAWLPDALTEWIPLIERTADRYGLDPELLALQVLVESGGRADAHSPTGAVGLMQVMPGTADRIQDQRGVDPLTEEQLWDPETNLDLGAWYLAQQLDEFASDEADESLGNALAAYNAGPVRVTAALRGEDSLSDETRMYTERILELWDDRDLPCTTVLDDACAADLRLTGDLQAALVGAGQALEGVGRILAAAGVLRPSEDGAEEKTLQLALEEMLEQESVEAGTVRTRVFSGDEQAAQLALEELVESLSGEAGTVRSMIMGDDAGVQVALEELMELQAADTAAGGPQRVVVMRRGPSGAFEEPMELDGHDGAQVLELPDGRRMIVVTSEAHEDCQHEGAAPCAAACKKSLEIEIEASP
jgi:beta-lactamase regulating signal transducer with metallopeptidase domain